MTRIRFDCFRFLIVTASIICGLIFNQPARAADDPKNILSIANGTVLMKYSSSYNESSWSAFNMIDGNKNTGWCSRKYEPKKGSFTFELPRTYKVTGVVFDNTKAQEYDYPGISAKTVKIFAKTDDEVAFRSVGVAEIPKGSKKGFTLDAKANSLQFVVSDNWGHDSYTELMEVSVSGKPLGPIRKHSFTGIYASNYGPMKLTHTGNSVNGCYIYQNGTITGTVDNRVLNFQWIQQHRTGAGQIALSTDGNRFNGLWFENGAKAGEWRGKRDDDGKCDCRPGGSTNTVARDLKKVGRSILYGIYFDSDKATLKPESKETLEKVLSALTSEPGMKVKIEGHTDSTNTDAYNLKLSRNRANSVVGWLTEHGIKPGRLAAAGFGESKPVADNSTIQGRALNRRVEMVVVK